MLVGKAKQEKSHPTIGVFYQRMMSSKSVRLVRSCISFALWGEFLAGSQITIRMMRNGKFVLKRDWRVL